MHIGKNDYNTGVQVDPPKLNSIYSLIYFDLTNKPEKVTTDPKEMIFSPTHLLSFKLFFVIPLCITSFIYVTLSCSHRFKSAY